MSFNYGSMASMTVSLLTQFGVAATLRRYASDRSSYTDYAVVGVRERAGKVYDAEAHGMVQGRTVGFVIAAQGLAVEPDQRDVLVLDGVSYEIVGIDPIMPGGTALAYSLSLVK